MQPSGNAQRSSLATSESDLLSEIAAQVREASRSLGFERRMRIGRLVHERIFLSSRLAWRAGSSDSHATFRRLAALLRGSLSKSELHRCVQTYLIVQDLPFVRQSEHLTVSHVDVVASLNRFEQRRLLELAQEHHWTVRELSNQKRERLQDTNQPRGRLGRRPHDQVQAAAARCRRAANFLEEAQALLGEVSDDFPDDGDHGRTRELKEVLQRTERAASGLLRRLCSEQS